MYQRATDLEAESKKPEHQQNDNYCPEHNEII
jgi:hypothetical protein